MPADQERKGWWQTVPGILTAAAGIVTALTGFIAALQQVGFFEFLAADNKEQPQLENKLELEIPEGEEKCIDNNNICFKFSKHYQPGLHYQSGLILSIVGREPEKFDIYEYPQKPHEFQYKNINYIVEVDLRRHVAIVSIHLHQR